MAIKELFKSLKGELLPEGVRRDKFALMYLSAKYRDMANAEMVREGVVPPEQMVATRALKKATRDRRESMDFDTKYAPELAEYKEWMAYSQGRYIDEYSRVASSYDYPGLAAMVSFYERQLEAEIAADGEYAPDRETVAYSPYAHGAAARRMAELTGASYGIPPHVLVRDLPSLNEVNESEPGEEYSRAVTFYQLGVAHTDALNTAVATVHQSSNRDAIPRPL